MLQNKATPTYVCKGGNNDSHGTITLMILPTYISRSQAYIDPNRKKLQILHLLVDFLGIREPQLSNASSYLPEIDIAPDFDMAPEID